MEFIGISRDNITRHNVEIAAAFLEDRDIARGARLPFHVRVTHSQLTRTPIISSAERKAKYADERGTKKKEKNLDQLIIDTAISHALVSF